MDSEQAHREFADRHAARLDFPDRQAPENFDCSAFSGDLLKLVECYIIIGCIQSQEQLTLFSNILCGIRKDMENMLQKGEGIRSEKLRSEIKIYADDAGMGFLPDLYNHPKLLGGFTTTFHKLMEGVVVRKEEA